MEKLHVGIDLGTTYCAVSYFDRVEGKVKILKNSLDKETTPSVVCIEKGNVLIGDEAKDEQKSGNVNTIAFYKNMMGDEQYRAFLDGKEYSAEDLSGIFLKYLVKDIEKTNNVNIESAVITVPAYFNEKQRLATIHAGEKAGLKVLKIINEPTAAIISYGLTSGKEKNVMVYDLGGGTFDITVAHVNGTEIDVLATNGNHQLGGKDWDQVLFNEIVEKFYSEYSVNINDYSEDANELQVKCEEAKKRLSSVSSTSISIQCQGFLGKYEVSNDEFEDKTYPFLNETVLLIHSCFDEIKEKTNKPFGWNDIDEVVLVGGSTRMPQVKKMIIAEYGKAPITKDINVDTIVATGAAMQAELCVNQKITLTVGGTTNNSNTPRVTISLSDVKDITSHGLGMLALSSDEKNYVNSMIIKKNSKVNEVFYRNYNFGGNKLDVYILQGESNDPDECNIIGKYSITGMSGKKEKIQVGFLYDQNGVVQVIANSSDGTTLQATKEEVTETLDEVIERLNKEKEEAKKATNKKIEVVICIDNSGSMEGSRISKAKEAAIDFVKTLNLPNAKIMIATYNNSTLIRTHFTKNQNELTSAINSITTTGGTSANVIGDTLSYYSNDVVKIMIILTDGYWFDENIGAVESSANYAKSENVTIYAIGIGDADEAFLNKISSGKGKKVDLSKLTETFKEVASSIATEVNNNSIF